MQYKNSSPSNNPMRTIAIEAKTLYIFKGHSDRNWKNMTRLIAILLIIAALVGLSLYTVRSHPWVELNDCLENPEAFDGRTLVKYSEPMIGNILEDGFRLLQKNGPSIRVYADTAGLVEGKYIGMKAIFHKEGYLTVQVLRVHEKRRHKMWLSVIPAFLVVILFFRHFRFNLRKCHIAVREHA